MCPCSPCLLPPGCFHCHRCLPSLPSIPEKYRCHTGLDPGMMPLGCHWFFGPGFPDAHSWTCSLADGTAGQGHRHCAGCVRDAEEDPFHNKEDLRGQGAVLINEPGSALFSRLHEIATKWPCGKGSVKKKKEYTTRAHSGQSRTPV